MTSKRLEKLNKPVCNWTLRIKSSLAKLSSNSLRYSIHNKPTTDAGCLLLVAFCVIADVTLIRDLWCSWLAHASCPDILLRSSPMQLCLPPFRQKYCPCMLLAAAYSCSHHPCSLQSHWSSLCVPLLFMSAADTVMDLWHACMKPTQLILAPIIELL